MQAAFLQGLPAGLKPDLILPALMYRLTLTIASNGKKNMSVNDAKLIRKRFCNFLKRMEKTFNSLDELLSDLEA